MTFQLVLVVAVLLSFQQSPKEVVRESYPNGTPRLEREVERNSKGDAVPHGASREWHPNGQVAAEGRFGHGQRQGAWTFWHENGERSARGRFEGGARKGKWFFWDPAGEEDRERTGEYALERIPDPSGGLRALGYRRDGQRNGVWRFLWPDGRVQFTGRYRNGLREGTWVFFHSDGAPASLLLSGAYEGGRLASQLSQDVLQAFQPEQELGLAEAEAAESSVARPAATRHWAVDWSERLVALESMDLGDKRFVEQTAKTLPLVLGGFGREGFGWNRELTPAGLAARREFLRSLRSLWELKRDDAVYWNLDLRGEPDHADELLRSPPLLPEEHPTAAQSRESTTYFAGRFRERDAKEPLCSEACEQAVLNALTWLAQHQSLDGSWDSDAFQENNSLGRTCVCSGKGQQGWDVGVTSLALLAFLGAGHTPYRGEHADVVTRGLASLLDVQDSDGCFRTTWPAGENKFYIQQSFIYEHTLATMALAEAFALTGHAALRSRLQSATNFLLRAQNPYAAWRYDYPPSGESDTSVTAWVVQALRTAEEAGVLVDPAAYSGAINWINEVTDPATGRCGYNEMGTTSVRLVEVMERFPADRSEAMSAAALLTRVLAGEDLDAQPLIEKHSQLLLFKLPSWEPSAGSIDFVYWYFGSHAMWQLGGPKWSAWSEALIPAVVDHQCLVDDERGSWDPIDAWGVIGGRVYATAICALTLESATRIGRRAATTSKKQ